MTIGSKIKALRKAKGLTQEELAKKLGVSASMVGQYETGLRNPKLETLERFASALGANITEIVDLSDLSPSLNDALPLICKLKSILDNAPKSKEITLSIAEKNEIDALSNIISNLPEEIASNNYISNILKKEYISLFDRLNLYGKYMAIKAVLDLVNAQDSEENS